MSGQRARSLQDLNKWPFIVTTVINGEGNEKAEETKKQTVKSELINMTRPWDKEKIWVCDRNRPMTSRTPGGRSVHWATRTHGEHAEQGHLTEFICDRCPAYCWDQHCRSHHKGDKSTLLDFAYVLYAPILPKMIPFSVDDTFTLAWKMTVNIKI